MDLAAASSLSLFTYETALRKAPATAGPGPALLSTLTAAYAGASSAGSRGLPAGDALSTLAGDAYLAPLLAGIYQLSPGSGSGSPATNLISSLNGLEAGGGSGLLAALPSGGLDGFAASLNGGNALALESYTAIRDGLGGPLGQAASRAAATYSNVQSALTAAQANVHGGVMDLLG